MPNREGKSRFVKVEAIELRPDEEEDIEWYAVGRSRGEAKSLADEMGMPVDSRKYTDLYITEDQYEKIPVWR